MPESDNSHIVSKRLELTRLFFRSHLRTTDIGPEQKSDET
jgi:hypothetical protein